ncbi:MAG: hypothetical protein IIB42_07225, partial [Candidatus Marinimicrobia bacterium]|nr:hypothetical protein [Candidatus Neomarinimicrobiota bacterium]
MTKRLSRRKFLHATVSLSAGLPLLARLKAATPPLHPAKGNFPVRVIASANGLKAVQLAYGRMAKGTDPLDAVADGSSDGGASFSDLLSGRSVG